MKDEKALSNTNVTVMHLEEDENGQVKDVVDMSENDQLKKVDTSEKKEVQTAEFVTESFSAFTLTWTYEGLMLDSTKKLTVNYKVLENGQYKDLYCKCFRLI